jgi:tRNA dimethylallyltransferase
MDANYNQPLVVICGPTASGKSSIALDLASQKTGEIICADSRTIYKGMDIGTAKPTKKEQNTIPHHLLDVVEPGERFTVYDFQQRAKESIKKIRANGRLPILVGGTGLYIDSIIFDYEFPLQENKQNDKFTDFSLNELQRYCLKNNISLPENSKNKRYIINSILRNNESGKKRSQPIDNTMIIGITANKEELIERITSRTEHMFERGVVEEAKKLGEIYGWENEAMTGNIYPLLKQYLDGTMTRHEVIAKFIVLDKRLAKRQMTWLKRNSFIHWSEREEALGILLKALA